MKEVFSGLGIMYMLSVIVMLAVIVAMSVDCVSGWRKAKLRGDDHTSYAFSRSLTKFLIYEGILIIGVCIDTMIHFAWWMLVGSYYVVPLLTIAFGIILCIVEVWSVKEKAEKKARKRMDEAATALAKMLDKETVLEILREQRNMRPAASVDDEAKARRTLGTDADMAAADVREELENDDF